MQGIVSTLIRKLSSRKLWMAIAVVVSGVSVAMGNDASEIESVTGIVSALIGSVAYIITEGKIDAAGITDIAIKTEAIKDSIDKIED